MPRSRRAPSCATAGGPRLDALPSNRVSELRDLYLLMGGEPARFDQVHPGGWDLAFADGLLVELDERQHFNRYRSLTLIAPWAASLPWTKPYVAYCAEREHECLRHGKGQQRWTNPSAERFFGVAQLPGNFDGVGSPRWRRRAFYDAMKDATLRRRLARVSVYDTIGGRPLETILRTRDVSKAGAVRDLVGERASYGVPRDPC